MAGGFTCPHCDNFNRCSCNNCKQYYTEKDDIDNFVKWDESGELCICAKCNKTFHEGQSLDIEWEKMMQKAAQVLTKEVCYEWMTVIYRKQEAKTPEEYKIFSKSEKDMYEKYIYKTDWFVRMFSKHFKIHPYDVLAKPQAYRDLQINKLTND